MHAYRDQYATVFKNGENVVLIGISNDSAEELQSWAADDGFPFHMASDPTGSVAKDYGVGARDNGMVGSRAVVVIDPSQEAIAVNEARKLHIPLVATSDTNCDPDLIDFPIIRGLELDGHVGDQGRVAVDVDGGRVRIAYIDAEDGSPVLDLKPYVPATDRIRDVAYPDWAATWPQWYEDSATFDWGTVFENAQ